MIGVAGSDDVVTGIVVAGTVEVEVSVAAIDVGTSVTCTVVGVSTSDGVLDEQAARTPRLKDASRTGAITRVFIPLACPSSEPAHALNKVYDCEAQPGRFGRAWRIFTAVSTMSFERD